MAKKKISVKGKNMSFSLDMDIPEVEEFKIFMYEALKKSAIDIEKVARVNGSSGKFYKNWSGKLTKSIAAKAVSYDKIKFFNTARYAPYVEWGTGIYATQGGGRSTPWVYYNNNYKQWVTTRGQKATHFMEKSLEESEPLIERNIEKIVVEWWNE